MSSGPNIFDRHLLRVRQRRARRLTPATFLLDRVAADLGDRLSAVLRKFDVAVDLGTPSDAVRRVLAANNNISTIVAAGLDGDDDGLRVTADEETLPFAERSLDLVVSALALQFVNDLPGALIQIRRALKPDGLLLAAIVGGESLTELRSAFAAAESEVERGISPRVAPFADSERVTVRYDSALALMRDLRRMGATNILHERLRTPLKRRTLERVTAIYADRFADADGRVRATFEIIWLSGWVPHESQQKPLKPGSAAQRLADALGTIELPAGEKPERGC